MKKRISALLLAALLVAALIPVAGFAASTTKTVGVGKDYATLTEAMTAVNSMTGDVILEIYGEVEFNDNVKLYGSYDSISFVAGAPGAKITINKTQSWCQYLESNATASFTGLILAKANPAWTGNSGHMGNYFSIQGGTTTYTDCTFLNGACISTGTAVYNNCTFENSAEYGLWVYDDAIITVNGGTIDSKKGIKVYSEDETSVTSTLTVQNATFTENVTAKPAVAIGYAASVTLIGNTYNNTTGELELDSGSDADCNGVTLVAKDATGADITAELKAVDRSNGNAPCGVLITDASGNTKIYTTVTSAAAEAQSGETIVLLHNSSETVELGEGVLIQENGFTAENVTGERAPEPVAPAYAGPVMNWVKVNAADNGVVKSGPLAASAGATITLYPKAAEGYVLDTVTVLDAEGNAVELDGLKFAVPAGGVTVNATFKLAE